MSQYDLLSPENQKEYVRLYESLGRPDARNRGQLDALVAPQFQAVEAPYQTAYAGRRDDYYSRGLIDYFNLNLDPGTPRHETLDRILPEGRSISDFVEGGSYLRPYSSIEEYQLPVAPLTPVLALSADIGVPGPDRSLFQRTAKIVTVGAIAAGFAAGAAGAFAGETVAVGTGTAEAGALTTANGAANVSLAESATTYGASGGLSVAETFPAAFPGGTVYGAQPAFSVASAFPAAFNGSPLVYNPTPTWWASDTLSASLNPSLADAASVKSALPSYVTNAAKTTGGKIAAGIANKYLGNSAAYSGEGEATEPASNGTGYKNLLIVGGALIAVGILTKLIFFR